ncbi:MAG TPA: hypothetical protein EYP46_04275, partial [Hadesarchaea archaeon]|nr:hypothetical protein [Hadesarchaea archaeon]
MGTVLERSDIGVLGRNAANWNKKSEGGEEEMKVIPKMAGALILMVILVASASVVAADTADTKDSPSYQITVGDEDESGNV